MATLAELEKKLPDAYKLIIIALIATALVNAAPFGYDTVIISGVFAVIVAQLFDIGLTYPKIKKFVYSDSATIAALIITNVITPGQLIPIGVAVAAAMTIKHIICFEKHPVFNPAVTGLLAMPFLLSVTGISTSALETEIGWGNSTLQNTLGTATLIIFGFLVSARIRKLAVSLASFVAFVPFAFVTMGSIQFLPLFGAFFMYTEPRTSPVKTLHQIIFGISIFVFAFAFLMAGVMFQYAFSFAFLAANLLKIVLQKSNL